MANYPLQINKVVSALPSTLTANMLYAVRVGTGYDLCLADATGKVAYKINSANQLTLARNINGTAFDGSSDIVINRFTAFAGIPAGSTYNATVADAESFMQVGDNTTINLPASGLTPKTLFTIIHAGTGADSYINVSGNQFIYYPPTGLNSTSSKQLILKAGETVEVFFRGGNEFDVIGGSYLVRTLLKNIATNSIQAGAAPYSKGWRKLSATLPSAAGEVTVAHGITTVETMQGKVTDSDGLIVFNNDPDPARQFYIRVNGANIVLGVGSNATKVFGKAVTIYAGEEL